MGPAVEGHDAWEVARPVEVGVVVVVRDAVGEENIRRIGVLRQRGEARGHCGARWLDVLEAEDGGGPVVADEAVLLELRPAQQGNGHRSEERTHLETLGRVAQLLRRVPRVGAVVDVVQGDQAGIKILVEYVAQQPVAIGRPAGAEVGQWLLLVIVRALL